MALPQRLLPATLILVTAATAFGAGWLHPRITLWVPALYAFAVPFTTTAILLPLHPRFSLMRGPETLPVLVLGGLLLAACALVGAGGSVFVRLGRIARSQITLSSLKHQFGIVEKAVGAMVAIVKILQTVVDISVSLSGRGTPIIIAFFMIARTAIAQDTTCSAQTPVTSIIIVIDQVIPPAAPVLPSSAPFVDIMLADQSNAVRRLPDVIPQGYLLELQSPATIRSGLVRPVRTGSVFKSEVFITQPQRINGRPAECVGIYRFRELPTWSIAVESDPANLRIVQTGPISIEGRTGVRPFETARASWEDPISLLIYEIGDGLYFRTAPRPTDFRDDLTIRYDNQTIKAKVCETPRKPNEKRGRCSWFWQLLIDDTKTPESVTLRRTL